MKKIKSNPIHTMLVITVGFILIYFIFKWKWFLMIAFLCGITGIFSPFLSKQIDFLWMKLATVLSFIIPNIILGIIFYFFLFPIAIISKLLGSKDPLKIHFKGESMYRETEKQFDPKSFENPW